MGKTRPQIKPQLTDMSLIRGSTVEIWKGMQQSQISTQAAIKGRASHSVKIPTDANMIRLDVISAQVYSKLSDTEKATSVDTATQNVRIVIEKLLNSPDKTAQAIGSQCAQELGSHREATDQNNQKHDQLKTQYKEIKARIQDLIKLDAQIHRLNTKTVNPEAEAELKKLRDQRKALVEVLNERSSTLQDNAKTYLTERAALISKLTGIYQRGYAHMGEPARLEVQQAITPEIARPR